MNAFHYSDYLKADIDRETSRMALDADCPTGNDPAKIKRDMLYNALITIPDDMPLPHQIEFLKAIIMLMLDD